MPRVTLKEVEIYASDGRRCSQGSRILDFMEEQQGGSYEKSMFKMCQTMGGVSLV